MKLLELKIINFKGIDYFYFLPNGKNTSVYGENGTGKTTIADCFRWILEGKDTKDQTDHGRSPFIIKTISKNGQGTEREAYAKLQLDNNEIVELRRIHKDVLNREGKLIGSTTDFYIDDIPKKERDYNDFIKTIFPGNTLNILTNPFYFSENLSWQERRAIIFDIFGTKTDQEIIDNNKELLDINAFLGNHTVEDYKAIIKDQLKQLKKRKDEIPIRIDQAHKDMIDVDESKETELKQDKEKINTDIKVLQEKRNLLINDKGTIDKKAELAQIRQKISIFIQEYERKNDDEKKAKERELEETENKYKNIDLELDKKDESYKAIDNEIDEIEAVLIKLKQSWFDEKKKEFYYEGKTICFACKRPLEQEQIEENRQKALEQFNKEKSEKLEDIQNKGNKLRVSSDVLVKDRERLEKDIHALKNDKEQMNKKATAIEKQIQNIKEKRDKYTREKEFLALAKEEIQLTGQLEKLTLGDKKEEVDKIENQLKEAESSLDLLTEDILKISQKKVQIKNIEELEAEGKLLSAEELKLKGQLDLLNQFIRIKVRMIEDPINNGFKLANFKLFNQLVNGDIEDCCEVTDKNGVPFKSNLNKGAQMNIGLDIINTLSEYYNIMPIIFIDNAEGVTDIIKTKGQQIKLIVLPDEEKLKKLVEIAKESPKGLKVLTD